MFGGWATFSELPEIEAITKLGLTPILATISTLPVIVACALLGVTETRASTCRDEPSGCDPYVVTIA
jgi:hypothetical protein